MGLLDYLLINDYLINAYLSVSSVGAAVCFVWFILFLMPNIIKEITMVNRIKQAFCLLRAYSYSYIAPNGDRFLIKLNMTWNC